MQRKYTWMTRSSNVLSSMWKIWEEESSSWSINAASLKSGQYPKGNRK